MLKSRGRNALEFKSLNLENAPDIRDVLCDGFQFSKE